MTPTLIPAPLDAGSWSTTRHVRLSPALPEAFAVRCLRALRAAEHQASADLDPTSGHQRWIFAFEPGTDCDDHPLCDLGRALTRDIPPLLARLDARMGALTARWPLTSHRLDKGSFADPWVPEMAVLARLHLAPAPWPEAWGGHLEHLTRDGATHRHAPVWNTLDLFDLSPGDRLALTLLDHHVECYTVELGFVPEAETPAP